MAPIVFWQAQYLQVDALFSCFLMLALLALYFLEGESAHPARWRWVLRVALALAVLTKGPLAVVLAGLVVLTRCADRRSWAPLLATHPFRSILVFVALVVPWYVFAARAGGPAYAYDLVVNQNWNRFFQAFDHIQPWWFYLESIWSDFFPWTALALAGAVVLGRAGLFRARPELAFSATICAVCFVFLSNSQAKQGKYLLVAYPFAAVLVAALAVEAERRAAEGGQRRPAPGGAGLGRDRRDPSPGGRGRSHPPRAGSCPSRPVSRRSSRSRSASGPPGPSPFSSGEDAKRFRRCSLSPPRSRPGRSPRARWSSRRSTS